MPSIFSTMFRRSGKRRAYAELLGLDDHLLRDIGITRSDVRSAMAHHSRIPPFGRTDA